MSALPTPPVTPTKASFDAVNDIAAARHPNPPHNYSLTPLQLLPKRLNYRRMQAVRGRQPRLIILTEVEIARAAPRMHRAMWGIDRVDESERAEAAAILEAVASRSIVWKRDGRLFTRWRTDDERTSGRVYDRLWRIETARLIPWRYTDADYTGPSMVYDVLIGRVRRLQIQDQARFRDVEDNLGVWGREMEVTKRLRGRGVESEDEEEEDEEMRDEDSEEDESQEEESEESDESEESEEDGTDEDEPMGDE